MTDGEPGLTQWVDPLNRTYMFQLDTNGLSTQSTWPELNYVTWRRDGAGNVLDQTMYAKPPGTSTLASHQTFDPCTATSMTCDKPITITDPRGNVTQILYNAHGQKIAEIGPADANGVRPLHRWSYTDVYAYAKNASGTLVSEPSPVSMLTSEIVCRSSFNGNTTSPACGSSSDEVVTAYEYGAAGSADTLLLRSKIEDSGSGRLNLRTCYGYDPYGNKIWETSPRAGLTACP